MIKNFLKVAAASLALIATSCSAPKDISYFQDLTQGMQTQIVTVSPIKLQPNDKVAIIVSAGDGRLNTQFNLPYSRVSLGNSSSTSGALSSSGGEGVAPYTIDRQGDINFPVLGRLHIAGMTREELAEYIRRELISRDLVKNPIVTVEYLNLSVTVMGEVGHAGRFAIDREDYTILDALSAAGDLTIYGKRDNIRVLREDNGVQKVYEVNLNDGQALAQSPVYYLQQNDVIYVEPNNTKKRTSTPNGNSTLTPSFWMSIASFVASMAVLIVSFN